MTERVVGADVYEAPPCAGLCKPRAVRERSRANGVTAIQEPAGGRWNVHTPQDVAGQRMRGADEGARVAPLKDPKTNLGGSETSSEP